MKKFAFKLQRLLDIREAREREVKNELARVVGIQNQERAKQEDLRRGLDENKQKFHSKTLNGSYTTHDFQVYGNFVNVSIVGIDGAERRIKSLEPEVLRIREKLVQVSKERKIVEKLKERKLAEYNELLNQEIAKENDDINQKIFLRRMNLENQTGTAS
jgi:flagellar FliJ protein